MTKILGLDLGTNSIGWALIDDEKENNLIEDKGVIIFSEGVKNEKGTEISRAAERTGYRSARRLKFRRKIRKYNTLKVLAKNNMCPLSEDEVKAWRKSGFKDYPEQEDFLRWLRTDEDHKINPYYFRDKASREKIELLELGRAFYHIAQRRGFLSNRLDQSDKDAIEKLQPDLESIIHSATNLAELSEQLEEFFKPLDIGRPSKDLNKGEKKIKTLFSYFMKTIKEKGNPEVTKEKLMERLYKKENLGAVKQGISDLDDRIEKLGCKTLGQYFWKLYQQNRGLIENKIRTNYTAREEHYLKEFEIICKTQGLDAIDEKKKDASLRYSGIVKDLYRAIFYQRPLKSQKGLVGKGSLENTKSRCPESRPEYEEYRMYSFINNIKIKTPEDEKLRPLSEDERNKIISKFFRKSKPTFEFKELTKELGNNNLYNFKDNATVNGCPTIAYLMNIFGENWKTAIYLVYPNKDIRNRKSGETIRTKTEDEVIADIWHVLNTYTTSDKLEEFAIKKLGLNNPDAEKFSKINLKQDYASLSLNAINKILPYLKSGLIYPHAVFMANMENVVDEKKWANKQDRELIEHETKKIIDNHQAENKIQFVINSLLKNSKDNNFHYSEVAKDEYRRDLEKTFKNEFGNKTWDAKDDKDEILSQAFEKFKKHLKAGTFLTIKRIDEKVLDFLSDNDLLKNPDKLYHPSDIEKFKAKTILDKEGNERLGLGSPITGSIKNPMAMRTLHQLHNLVNTLIIEGTIDEHTKINIELARELNDANKRKAIERWQKDKEYLHKIYAEKIQELYKGEINPTDSDIEKFQMALEQRKDKVIIGKTEIQKYNLWDEQNHICLYTGKTIGLTDFIGPNPKYDIEHTIPRSVSLDNSQMNKTICENKFNREVKQNKMPTELGAEKLEEILPRIEHWKKRYEAIDKEIERLIRATRGASDKDQKDRIIQKRHYLKMEYNYWKGKYDRFVMEEVKQGFKNSQFVDTGIITKYAVAYMKSVFEKVYSVKGEMVDQYRKAWGLHEKELDKYGNLVFDNNGLQVFKKKDRSNHIHHCIDAVTIASMDKARYDHLAHAWGLEEKGDYEKARNELEQMKPWETFTEDVRKMQDEVLIAHHAKDNLPKQTKKKLRKRGIIQRDKNGNIIYQQGDTVRGSLHLDTFYGTIEENGELKHVVRKELSKLKDSDIKNIVDDNIRAIVEQAKADKKISFTKTSAKLSGEPIWQNEAKQIPLKKIRVFTPAMKNPLPDFKQHAKPFLSKKEYKQQFNVANDENYCMAIYEGKDKKGNIKREFELVNNIDAGKYFKLSNTDYRKENPMVELHKKSHQLKTLLTKGQLVLFFKETPDEIWDIEQYEKIKRLYKIIGFEGDGRIQFRYHQTAMQQSSKNKEEMTITKYMKDNNLKNSEIDFVNPVPWLRLTKGDLNFLVNHVDFKITSTGKIEKL